MFQNAIQAVYNRIPADDNNVVPLSQSIFMVTYYQFIQPKKSNLIFIFLIKPVIRPIYKS